MTGSDVVNFLLLISLLVFLVIAAINYFTAPRLTPSGNITKELPMISILIPARNEEKNISKCLDSVTSLDYPRYEIIVYDDDSIDSTANMVGKYANVTLIRGGTLPGSWTGKNYACANLTSKAIGECFLFLDADVELQPHAVTAALELMQKKNASMISCFPDQRMGSFGELLTIPLLNFVLLGFLPLIAVYKRRAKRYSAAIGQFILIKKSAYEAIGGHTSIKNDIVDDLAIARKMKESGFTILAALAGQLITCRMYEGSVESFAGFGKNFFKGFNLPAPIFFLILNAVAVIFLFPVVFVFFSLHYVPHVCIIVLIRMLISGKSNQSILLNTILHVPQMLILYFIGMFSMLRVNRGGIRWKGRLV